jgi:very-short-patch-repair endonuclease
MIDDSERYVRWRQAAAVARTVPGTREAVDRAGGQGFVLTKPQARAAGLTTADVRRLVRRGTWTELRRNIICVLPAPTEADLADHDWLHGRRAEVVAAAAQLAYPASVVSHDSAAAMRALPLLRPPARPTLTATYGSGFGRPDINLHLARTEPIDIDSWFGVAVTTAARTVIDVARNAGPRAGLVLADAALHQGLASLAQLEDVLFRQVRWPGIRTARRVVELAEPLAESPLESLVRLLVVDNGLPAFAPQRWVQTRTGRFRVDGLWADRWVVLEVDGLRKYGDLSDLIAEKKRQEAIERAGYRVVRVTWSEYWTDPVDVIARIREALRAGGPGLHRSRRTSSGAA